MFVTLKAALGPAFGTYLNHLHGLHQVDRIVIDECHVVLNQQAEFRPTLQRLGELSRLAVQMMLLTTILPPRLEALLWTRMIVNAKEVAMFRDRTTRANIAYRVISTQSHTEARADLVLTVSALLESLAPHKLLVYCNSRDETMELARELQCPAYHHLLDCDTCTAAQVQFSTTGRLMMATSAFGLGIDIANIRAVLHASCPRRLLDFAQQSGRVGRDGQSSHSVVITLRSSVQTSDAAMTQFLEPGCR